MRYPMLSAMRDRSASTAKFRRASDALAPLLCEATIEAMGEAMGEVAGDSGAADDVTLVPVLRAALALLPAFTTALPAAPVGFLGVARDEETALPSLYYENLPEEPTRRALMLDPMLGTAGSSRLVVERLIVAGFAPENIYFTGVLAAPVGVERLSAVIPRWNITLAAIDDGLDTQNFIVPGLGDYGDRYFGT